MKKYVGFYLSMVYVILMLCFRLFTEIDSIYYITFFLPSAVIMPFYNVTTRILSPSLIVCFLYCALMWRDFSLYNFLLSAIGSFIGIVNILFLKRFFITKS